MRVGVALAVAATALLTAAWQRPDAGSFGFTRSGAAAQRSLERRFLALPSADRIRDAHRFSTAKPHIAGSARDRELAEWTRDAFRALRPRGGRHHDPRRPAALARGSQRRDDRADGRGARRCAKSRSPAIPTPTSSTPTPAFPTTPTRPPATSPPRSSTPAAATRGLRLADDSRHRRARQDRARPLLGALQLSRLQGAHGAAARRRRHPHLLRSRRRRLGKGKVYPDGPWGPESHIQRGGIAYDFLVPGDPLTPGWASLPGAPRMAARDAVSLPTIISAPLSYRRCARDPRGARRAGSAARRGAARRHSPYRAGQDRQSCGCACGPTTASGRSGPSPGSFAAREQPDDVVIVGNHRDAWVYGGVDPSSGSAALMELARRARGAGARAAGGRGGRSSSPAGTPRSSR